MKLSDKTISVLKNFSSINQSILFKEGSKLRTISVMKNILAEATVTEEFMKDFGIYDLNQFLNGLSLHQSPELDFQNDGYVVIREGKSRSKYFFADPNVIVTPPEKAINLPTEDVCFEVSTDQLEKLVEIVNNEVFHKLFGNSCFCQDVLHHTNSAKFATLFEQDRLIDRRKVLQDRDSFIRQFHSIRRSQFHWG